MMAWFLTLRQRTRYRPSKREIHSTYEMQLVGFDKGGVNLTNQGRFVVVCSTSVYTLKNGGAQMLRVPSLSQ